MTSDSRTNKLGAGNAATQNGKPKPVAEYLYRDECGEVLYKVVRFEPGHEGRSKDFLPYRPGKNGGWETGIKGIRRVLYRLDELMSADLNDFPVFVVEGEGKADSLTELGLLATSAPFGANAPWLPEYSVQLRGRTVVILPDHDSPGRKKAEDVTRQLAGVAHSVTFLELPGLVNEGDDVKEWLAAGGTKEELLKLALQAARSGTPPLRDEVPPEERGDAWEPPKPGTNGQARNPPRQEPRPEVFTAAELQVMELPEPQWAIPQIVPQGLSLLAGKPKLGKSWLALNLALAVATGGVALGSVRVEPGEVLYLALEDTKRRLKDRIAKLMTRQGLQEWPATLHLARSWPRQDKGGLYALLEWLSDHDNARLIVIDTWPKFRPVRTRKGDAYEEDYAHAAELKELADSRHVGIQALAHCRKLDAADPLDEVSGTLGLTGAADGVAVLRRERGRHDATLFLTGRDIDEREIALQWDPQYALWSILGDAEQYRLSKERQELIDVLAKAGKPLTPRQAATALGKSENAVKQLLWTMAQQGQLINHDGHYTIGNPGNPGNP